MSNTKPVGVAIVGCGNISGPYGTCLQKVPEKLRVVGAFDQLTERAEAFCQKNGGKVFPSFEALLNDPEVELVINLTIHTSHSAVTKQALLAGKHVHSEKPLATDREAGKEVVKLARKQRRTLSCSPFVILGEAQQTFWKAVRDGLIGEVVSVNAEMFWGRIERWHPNPQPFYEPGAGPMLDVGVYPLNVLTSILGPVKEVRGLAKITIPERKILSGPKEGQTFQVTTPDVVYGLLTFESGVIGRLTTTFSPWSSRQAGMEIHGTKGSLLMDSCVGFNSTVELSVYPNQERQKLPLVREPFQGVDWSRGPVDTAEAIRDRRPSRISGEQAFHILDVCLSTLESCEKGRSVKVRSRFKPPIPV